jgi:hypothetical protein
MNQTLSPRRTAGNLATKAAAVALCQCLLLNAINPASEAAPIPIGGSISGVLSNGTYQVLAT